MSELVPIVTLPDVVTNPAPLINWLLSVILFASTSPVYPKSAKVNVLLDIVLFAFTKCPSVFVVKSIPTFETISAPVKLPEDTDRLILSCFGCSNVGSSLPSSTGT